MHDDRFYVVIDKLSTVHLSFKIPLPILIALW